MAIRGFSRSVPFSLTHPLYLPLVLLLLALHSFTQVMITRYYRWHITQRLAICIFMRKVFLSLPTSRDSIHDPYFRLLWFYFQKYDRKKRIFLFFSKKFNSRMCSSLSLLICPFICTKRRNKNPMEKSMLFYFSMVQYLIFNAHHLSLYIYQVTEAQ